MKQRVITAIVLIAIFLPVLIIGGIAFDIAAFFFMSVASYEILNLFKKDWSLAMKLPVYFLFILGCVVALFNMNYYIILCSIMLVYLLFLVVQFEQVKFEQVGVVYMVFNLLVLTIASIHNMYQIVFYKSHRYLMRCP